MKVLAVIPARLGSTRLPGKPLVEIGGRPLIRWVYEAVVSSPAIAEVIVATDHPSIAESVRSFGGRVEMTGGHHDSGTDRVAEVAGRHPDAEVVVNIQGDQPFVTAAMIGALVAPYREGRSPEMTTLACPLADPADVDDPNIVKVVCDVLGRALYFSRSRIPHAGEGEGSYLHHLGLYAFRRDVLLAFTELPRGALERAERLEQLRALEHGHRIEVRTVTETVLEINTPEDVAVAEELLPTEQAR
jgi:3-deoxy-manno-octulosonate cytidylyltransferase (CMP-KDO synthetase)